MSIPKILLCDKAADFCYYIAERQKRSLIAHGNRKVSAREDKILDQYRLPECYMVAEPLFQKALRMVDRQYPDHILASLFLALICTEKRDFAACLPKVVYDGVCEVVDKAYLFAAIEKTPLWRFSDKFFKFKTFAKPDIKNALESVLDALEGEYLSASVDLSGLEEFFGYEKKEKVRDKLFTGKDLGVLHRRLQKYLPLDTPRSAYFTYGLSLLLPQAMTDDMLEPVPSMVKSGIAFAFERVTESSIVEILKALHEHLPTFCRFFGYDFIPFEQEGKALPVLYRDVYMMLTGYSYYAVLKRGEGETYKRTYPYRQEPEPALILPHFKEITCTKS